MSLRMIGAGLGRTGTTSLKAALEQLLGGRCYHMVEVRARPDDAAVWGRAYQGEFPDWADFFDGYVATVDWPAAPFWPELSQAFPDAPILLSVRDAESWWKSASSTIFVALATYFRPDAPTTGGRAWARA
jgi:Sulfotransferase domain